MIRRLFLLLATCPNILQSPVRQFATTMQQIPNVSRFGETIRILGQNPGMMTLQGTNSYLIGTSKCRLLLDTTEPGKFDYVTLLKNVLKEENAKISDVLITHWHQDHIGCVKDLIEQKVIDDECKVWKFRRNDSKEDFEKLNVHELSDQQEFMLDNIKLKVFHTPGHTTDHVILYNPNDKTLYSGDCILGEGTAVFEDLYDYMNSLEKILELKPEKIYPGHGNVITGAVEKIQYYIQHRMERERQIYNVIAEKSQLSIMEIVKNVYKDTPESLWKAAAINVQHHLKKLKKERKIKEFENDGEEYWEVSSQINKL